MARPGELFDLNPPSDPSQDVILREL